MHSERFVYSITMNNQVEPRIYYLKKLLSNNTTVWILCGIFLLSAFSVPIIQFGNGVCNKDFKLCQDLLDAELQQIIVLTCILVLMIISSILCCTSCQLIVFLPLISSTVFINIPAVVRLCLEPKSLVLPGGIAVIFLHFICLVLGIVVLISVVIILILWIWSGCEYYNSQTEMEDHSGTTPLASFSSCEVRDKD